VTPTGTLSPTASHTDTLDPSLTPTLTFTATITPTANGTIVVFLDNGLYNAVKSALNPGNPPTPITTITSVNILAVNSLTAGTSSFEGLQYATNLGYYNAGGSTATTITQLSGLTQLTNLNLTNANITNLDALANCPLALLIISGSAVTSFAFLSDHADTLKELVYVSTYNAVATATYAPRVSDMSSLGGLTNLERLSLYGDFIANTNLPSSFAGMTSLKYVVLSGNRLSNLGFFSGCSAPITYLDLYSNPGLHSLAGIGGFTSAVTVRAYSCHLDGNGGVDFSGFSQLKLLHISNNLLTSSPSLPVSLREVALGNNLITGISSLSSLQAPKYIGIQNNQITDLQVLVDNVNITGAGVTVDVYTNPLSSAVTTTQVPALRSKSVSVNCGF